MAEPTPGNLDTSSPAVADGNASGALNVHLLNRKLADAEWLLTYAVDAGELVDPLFVRHIVDAGAVSRAGWTAPAATDLLIAEATLAAKLKPVSAESLRNCSSYRSRPLGRRLALPATMVVLAAVIVLYSTAAFLFSGFSESIRDNIGVANPLAVKLVDELGSIQLTNDKLCPTSDAPAGASQKAASGTSSIEDEVHRKYVIADLQTFAAAIRDMYGAAQQLNRLYPFSSRQLDPIVPAGIKFTPDKLAEVLELPPGLPNLALAATERVCVYQRVRYYAQSTEQNATVFIGAVATGILPVLYALLGAGAYVLRRLESQLRSHTLVSEAHSPRFITAAIAGAVVGLFNFGQGVSVSPLAIAFLAGYAADVFFMFLEGLIQTLSKTREYDASGKAKK
jgi:hypothetical protein